MGILSHILKSKKGSTLVGSLFIIVGLTFFASSAVYVTNGENRATVNEMQTTQALQVGSAGLEYASKQLELGLDPSITDKALGTGSFTITTEPTSHTVTVTSFVGDARKVQSITTDNFSDNCVGFDTTSQPYIEGNDIYDVQLVQTCNDAAYITSMVISWDWTPCVLDEENGDEECAEEGAEPDTGGAQVDFLAIGGTTIYDPASSIGSPTSGANAGETIDVEDFALTGSGTYALSDSSHGISFDTEHPGYGSYTLTVVFADGSQSSATFYNTGSGETEIDEEEFAEEDGTITVYEDNNVTVEVLGTSITYGAGGAEIPVMVELGYVDANGDVTYTDLFDGVDVDGGESYTEQTSSDVSYVIRGEANYKSGKKKFYSQYDSTDTVNVKTLVNGEAVPDIDAFDNQTGIEEYLADYINYVDGEPFIVLADNQVIMLFELGVNVSTNPNSSAADFQDLVVLFTIDPATETATTYDSSNNGHGNNCDGVDVSNPGNGSGGPNGEEDPSGTVDDEECADTTSDSTDSSSTEDDSSTSSYYFWWYGSSSQKDL